MDWTIFKDIFHHKNLLDHNWIPLHSRCCMNEGLYLLKLITVFSELCKSGEILPKNITTQGSLA